MKYTVYWMQLLQQMLIGYLVERTRYYSTREDVIIYKLHTIEIEPTLRTLIVIASSLYI